MNGDREGGLRRGTEEVFGSEKDVLGWREVLGGEGRLEGERRRFLGGETISFAGGGRR